MITMSHDKTLLLCYNRGCGDKFDPNNNHADACSHHPGHPIFHDAYKGWSCCNKKCTDFTEFLNIKGCTKSFHSNEKPPEPEKPSIDKQELSEIIEYRAPVNDSILKRPPFDTPQVTLTPTISPALLEQIKDLNVSAPSTVDKCAIQIGECCKNKACKATYQGPESNDTVCINHPGVPIFHEGLKYWSCCQKKTTDFSTFLEQPGCTEGAHTWMSMNVEKEVKCRTDWHQTGSFVVISIYAKKYQPSKSSIKLNPIRLTTSLFFPMENSLHNMDLELRGIIDVEKSSVNMLPTKIEIKMKKAEPGHWVKLDYPLAVKDELGNIRSADDDDHGDTITTRVDAVDLNDL